MPYRTACHLATNRELWCKISAKKLTDLTFEALTSNTPTNVWDAKLPAFGVYVGKNRKTFVVIQKGGRRRKIGRYPSMSLADARKRALTILYAVEPEMESIKSAPAVEQFMRTHHRGSKPSHQREQQRLLDKYFLPVPGAASIARITPEHSLRLTDALAGEPSEQLHLHRALRTFSNRASERSYVTASPLARLSPPAKQDDRDRVLTDAELREVWSLARGRAAAISMSRHWAWRSSIGLTSTSGNRRSVVATLTDPL